MTEEIRHSERTHVALGGSSTYRWWNCPGSINLINLLGRDASSKDSVFSREGTAAHELAELCLRREQEAADYIGQQINGITVDALFAEAVQTYVTTCREYLSDPDWECWIERRFTLKPLDPPGPMAGTSDFVAINRKRKLLTVIDLKFGQGVRVDAKGNFQIRYYALGALLSLPPSTRIDTVVGIIVQPRVENGTTTDSYSVFDLGRWGLELIEHAKATLDPKAPLNPGPWCSKSFCPARGRCPAQSAKQLTIVQDAFAAAAKRRDVPTIDVKLLTPEEVGALYSRLDEVEAAIKAIREAAMGFLKQGIPLPDGKGGQYKLKPSLGHRKYVDQKTAEGWLTSVLGISDNDIWERELISPATAEKLAIQQETLKKDSRKTKAEIKAWVQAQLAEITTRPETAPKIELDTDPIPAQQARRVEFVADKGLASNNK